MVRTDQEILALGKAGTKRPSPLWRRSTAPTATPWPATCWATTPTREECVNDAYLAVWNAIPRAQPQNLLAYLAKTTRNIALRRLEHDQAQKRDSRLHLLLDELAEVLPGRGPWRTRPPRGTGGGHQHLPQGEGHPGRAAALPPPVLLGGLHPGPGPGLPVQREQGEIPPFPGAEAAAGLPGGKGVDGVKGEKLYELLDALDDTLVLESAEVKRTTWRRRLYLVAAVVAVIAAVWFFTTEPVRHPLEDVGARSA